MSFSSLTKILIGFLLLAYCSSFANAAPLLQEGKKSVYQRAVTHPNAKLYSGPEADAKVIRDPVTTFTAMYIYDRDGDRVQVGSGTDKPEGWIEASEITEWPQAITMVFTDRTGRDPVLFFRTHDDLEETCRLDDIGAELKKFEERISSNPAGIPDDYPVVASEPREAAVSEKNFYLLPVLSIDDQFYQAQGPRLIEVASINPGIPGSGSKPGSQNKADFRTGFAFVIDTTISMKPYIDETLNLIKTLYDDLENNPYANNIGFAVVAFRSNVDKTPGLEYTAKVICDFTTVKDRERLEKALSQVKEATVSSHDVNEDSFAGVKEAIDQLSWSRYGSRVMMLVSDAGPLGAGDPTSKTGMSPETLAEYLRANNVYLTALHIINPRRSKAQVKYAADAYKILSKQSDNMASYININASTPGQGAKAFEKTAKELAKAYENIVTNTAEGKLIEKPETPVAGKKLSPEEEARRIAQSTGYAMQLQFFGNAMGSTAPEVVNAWIADADLEKMAQNPGNAPILAVEPAVLLTKGQLSNLYKQLKMLLAGSEKAFLNGDEDLFGQIASAAAQMSRDPNQFSLHPDRNLAENGLLDEVLEDLPYKSQVGSMSRQDWEAMSTGQRDEFIKRIKSLLALYEAYDKDSTHWEDFGARNPNDRVYRVPLRALP